MGRALIWPSRASMALIDASINSFGETSPERTRPARPIPSCFMSSSAPDGRAARLIEEVEAAIGACASAINLENVRIDDSDELKVLSPAAAIFYSASSPTEAEYVSVGDIIGVETTLCQLEAMKIFTPLALQDFNPDTELYSPDLNFEVTRVNISSGQQVNVGDLLFVVKPLK